MLFVPVALFKDMNPLIFLWHYPFKGLCTHFKNWSLTPRGHECHTHLRFLRKLILTRRNLNKNRRYFTHWSVAQAGSNDNWRSKISLDCPLRRPLTVPVLQSRSFGRLRPKQTGSGRRPSHSHPSHLEQGGMPEGQLHHLLDLGQLLAATTDIIIPANNQ